MRVLLLGADGNAGRNYAKCIKMADHTIEIIGTGFSPYHGLAAVDDALLNEYHCLEEMGSAVKYNWVRNMVEKADIDFVHAQPEEEVDFLCDYGDVGYTRAQGAEIPCLGKSILQRQLFKDKMKVQKILGTPVEIMMNMTTADWRDMFEQGGDGKVWLRSNVGSGSKNALKVGHYTDAQRWVTYLKRENKIDNIEDIVATPYLPGREFAVQLFYINGECYHAQARERIEHFFAKQMISGTSSTPSVAKIAPEWPVYQRAYTAVEECVRSIGYEQVVPDGIYGVDMREDVEGKLVVTEVNYGRYFTTSDFFAEVGVNTPYEELQYGVFKEFPTKRIASVNEEIYWIRGLDREPFLLEV